MTMCDFVLLLLTFHDPVLRCVTFPNFFKLLKLFKQFKLFYTIQMSSNFSYFSINPNYVYLCSNDASMHKFCAWFFHYLIWLVFKNVRMGLGDQTQKTKFKCEARNRIWNGPEDCAGPFISQKKKVPPKYPLWVL